MVHCNTILSLILRIVPRHEFEALANQRHTGRSFRKASRRAQFTCMVVAQLSERCSLRDIVECVSSQELRGAVWETIATLPAFGTRSWFPVPQSDVFTGRHGDRIMPDGISLGGFSSQQGRGQIACWIESRELPAWVCHAHPE